MHNCKVACIKVNTFIARNSYPHGRYEVAILTYFEQGGLEKQRCGPPYSRGNSATESTFLNIPT